jgi:SAM-dependent methyltransferase
MKTSSIRKTAPRQSIAEVADTPPATKTSPDLALAPSVQGKRSLDLEPAACAICATADSEPIGLGEDFEYRTSADSFLAVRCRHCGLVYLDPRPAGSALSIIYPDSYHAFDFSSQSFGLIYRIRGWLEMRRLLGATRELEAHARILDIGCGNGFHLGLLRQFGEPGWRLEGVEVNPRAILAARRAGFTIHEGPAESVMLPQSAYDLVLLIQTIEHLGDPLGVLRAIRRALKPGGRLIVVTDNAASLDARIFAERHWGGYHFPRHWYLFDARTLRRIAQAADLEIVSLSTLVSPVNWLYSVHNLLADWGCSPRTLRAFSLKSALALAVFTLFDMPQQWLGQGALLQAVLERRPAIA